MKKMRSIVVLLIFFLFFCKCYQHNEGKSSTNIITLINDILLETIDTSAYLYHSLIPLSTDGNPKPNSATDSVVVALSNELQYPQAWIGRIKNELANNFGGTGDTAFGTVLLSIDKKIGTEKIKVADIVNKGRFKLTDQYDFRSKETSPGFAGVLIFSQFFFNATYDRAITVVEIRGNIKGGREELLLLKKENGRWMIQNRLLLAIA